jgi:L-threonylcarbamoyladenylate synthase
VSDEVDRAVAAWRAGRLVAFPTETVYGLGADAARSEAVRRIFAVKHRPVDHPLIVHLGDAEMLGDGWAASVIDAARALADAFWPGPLTLLLPKGTRVANEVTGGRETVGIRVPSHPLALELLRTFGGGVAAPSANRFGKVSPTTAAHVRADLGDDVEVVLDGGPSEVGVESTIVDCTVEPFMILRHGGVPVADIERVLGNKVAPVATGPSRASGMLESHYAPACRVELAGSSQEAATRAAALRAHGELVDVLDPDAGAELYARHLYGWLREADDRGLTVLIAVPPPNEGLGAAVNDRLRKAAAPRPR